MDENENNYIECTKKTSKKVLKRGQNLRRASDGSVCCVLFKGLTGNDSINSVHLLSTTSTITIGTGNETVDRVVEYCVQSMAVAEESEFTIDASTLQLKFTATLENCYFKPYSFQMSDIEKFSFARWLKEQGVDLFKSSKIPHAFRKFRRALQYVLAMKIHYNQQDEVDELMDDAPDHEEVAELQVIIYNNLAMCQLQYKNYDYVILLCTKSLMIQANVKAYYRRGVAFLETQDYENAEKDFLECLKIDENNKAAETKLKLARELDQKNRQDYRETVKKMFTSNTPVQ